MTVDTKQSELALLITKVEKKLDGVVEQGTDQELFISSYLQGHFAVMAGQSEVKGMTQISQLDELMQASLQRAFANNELAADDQQQVWDLWNGYTAE